MIRLPTLLAVVSVVPAASGFVNGGSSMSQIVHALTGAAVWVAFCSDAATQCVPGDLNSDGIVDGADIGLLLLQWGDSCPPLTVASVAPSTGPLGGGVPIAVTGIGFGELVSVEIGGVLALHSVRVSPTTIVALAPPSNSSGSSDVTVTTSTGSATLKGGFIYSSDLPWATIIEQLPDSNVVTNNSLLNAIVLTGLPWRVRDNSTQIEMLLVPPGSFAMGCTASVQAACNEDGREHPIHTVTITQPFYLGRHEVTQAQWTAVMGSNPSYWHQWPDSPSRPVDRVSWNDVQEFNAATGLRLPTEAEWEYACRAGSTFAFNNGSNDDVMLWPIAWFSANAGEFGTQNYGTKPVGQKLPNALGLYDMHGNVMEWVGDWYSQSYYSISPGIDPVGPFVGTERVLRGGHWFSSTTWCRSSARHSRNPSQGDLVVGFRAARNP
jgi:formylglycine-generating enzyme required for sulfatase activity